MESLKLLSLMCAIAARYLLRIKYHKASPIDAFGPPYLRLEWTRTDLGVNISASPTEREVSLQP